MKSSDWRAFRVTVRLAAPVISDPGALPTLDAILAARLFESGSISTLDELPLLCNDGLYHGSSGIVSGVTEVAIARPITARLALNEYRDCPFEPPRNGKIGRQWSRPRLDYFDSISAESVTWYGFGDVSAVGEVIDCLPGVGKKVRQGYGAIVRGSAEIEVIEDDRSLIIASFGRPQPSRPMPVSRWRALCDTPSARIGVTTWKPPYWDYRSRNLCALPRVL
jgi:hypothetical protein